MGFGGGGSIAPPAIPLPPAAAHPATLASVVSKPARKTDSGMTTADNTIATSPQGLKTKPSGAYATLLGQ